MAMHFGPGLIFASIVGATIWIRQSSLAAPDESSSPFENQQSIARGIFEEPDISDEAIERNEAKVGLGYESNVFEVDSTQNTVVGDLFTAASVKLSRPLGDKLAGLLEARTRAYFRQSQIDEYLIRASSIWSIVDDEPLGVKLGARVFAFRERIFNEFQHVPDRSEPGWGGGLGWNLNREFGESVTFTSAGNADFELFSEVPQDNVHITESNQVQIEINRGLTCEGGVDFEFQSYRQRPPDLESRLNPAGLETGEIRAAVGASLDVGRGITVEVGINAGPNIDFTNGYYNAMIIGGRLELKWRTKEWEIKSAVEPEGAFFFNRRANFLSGRTKLRTGEYLMELSVERRISEKIAIFASSLTHVQTTNSDEHRDDVSLNGFIDQMVSGGISVSF